MEAGLAGGLHVVGQADRLAEPMEDLGGANDVLERRLLGIEIDDAPVGELEGADATRPEMERDRAKVGDIDERILVVTDEVADLALGVLAPDADGAEPLRRKLGRILLIEHL